MRFNESVRISLVRRNINGRRVEIVEVRRPHNILRNAGGQRRNVPALY
jgi:hypothetical protein